MSNVSGTINDGVVMELNPGPEPTGDRAELIARLRILFSGKDVKGLIEAVDEFRRTPGFSQFCHALIREGKCRTTRIDEVVAVLIDEVSADIDRDKGLSIKANYFEIQEQLGNRFGKDLAEFYLSVKMPNDFLSAIRNRGDQDDLEDQGDSQLSNQLVEDFKREMVRTEKGRRSVIEVVQPYSNLPLQNVNALNEVLHQLYRRVKASYKYLSIKPYLLAVYQSDSNVAPDIGSNLRSARLFVHYLDTGEEPSVSDQIQLHIAIHRLFHELEKKSVIPSSDCQQFFSRIAEILSYQGKPGLASKGRIILEGLLTQVNQDKAAIRARLARTFIEEYHSAENQMQVRRTLIINELAATREYLKRIAREVRQLSGVDEERAKFAMEKLVCLKDVFILSDALEQAAAEKSFDRVERSALEISTLITPAQLTSWIRIYSIIYSNSEFLAYGKQQIDQKIVKSLISDLTTYHLIQNIAQLKIIVDRGIGNSDRRLNHFRQFNEALKLKLQGLMGTQKQQNKSLKEMIQELSFLQDESSQFVIAETFKGFQIIVDAFDSISRDYFVRDKEALLAESRGLYNEICNKCLRGFVTKPIELSGKKDAADCKSSRSWFGRLFTST
ncbi:MAG: hypothetical protein GY703_22770 [Gammaproteobacteria bacterium]|nr:hypothetical protein [Gammaproteobacteria bacterium]